MYDVRCTMYDLGFAGGSSLVLVNIEEEAFGPDRQDTQCDGSEKHLPEYSGLVCRRGICVFRYTIYDIRYTIYDLS